MDMKKLAVIEELLETARCIQKMLPPGHSIVFVSADPGARMQDDREHQDDDEQNKRYL